MNQEHLKDHVLKELASENVAEDISAFIKAEEERALAELEEARKDPQYRLTRKRATQMTRLIGDYLALEQHGKVMHRWSWRQALLAALLAAALLFGINANAITSFIRNYFISRTEQSMDYTEHPVTENHYGLDAVPDPTEIPEGFEPVHTENAGTIACRNFQQIEYRNAKGERILFAVYMDGTSIRSNAQEVVEYREVQIKNHPGVYVIRGGQYNLIWGLHPPCQLCGPAALKDELLRMAESVEMPE